MVLLIAIKFVILALFCLVVTMILIENVATEADETDDEFTENVATEADETDDEYTGGYGRQYMVMNANPIHHCFSEGDSRWILSTPRFQYCSDDADCKDSKKPGIFSDWLYPLCMDLQPNTPYANGTYGICCDLEAAKTNEEE